MVAEVASERRQNRQDVALRQEALCPNSASNRTTFDSDGGTKRRRPAKGRDGDAESDGALGRGHGPDSRLFVLVFFLLSSGDTFLRKLVTVIPTLKDKKRTVEIIRSIESDISFYLVMMLLINAGLGIGVAIITALMGIPDPLLWGTLTIVLSFAPYVGEMAIAVTLLVISMVTFDTLSQAIEAPAAYVLLMSAVHLTVPIIVRRRLLLNPVAVFVAIIFLGWIWGIPGALLAVPLLASFKVICERIEHLNPIAAFLTP